MNTNSEISLIFCLTSSVYFTRDLQVKSVQYSSPLLKGKKDRKRKKTCGSAYRSELSSGLGVGGVGLGSALKSCTFFPWSFPKGLRLYVRVKLNKCVFQRATEDETKLDLNGIKNTSPHSWQLLKLTLFQNPFSHI